MASRRRVTRVTEQDGLPDARRDGQCIAHKMRKEGETTTIHFVSGVGNVLYMTLEKPRENTLKNGKS